MTSLTAYKAAGSIMLESRIQEAFTMYYPFEFATALAEQTGNDLVFIGDADQKFFFHVAVAGPQNTVWDAQGCYTEQEMLEMWGQLAEPGMNVGLHRNHAGAKAAFEAAGSDEEEWGGSSVMNAEQAERYAPNAAALMAGAMKDPFTA